MYDAYQNCFGNQTKGVHNINSNNFNERRLKATAVYVI